MVQKVSAMVRVDCIPPVVWSSICLVAAQLTFKVSVETTAYRLFWRLQFLNYCQINQCWVIVYKCVVQDFTLITVYVDCEQSVFTSEIRRGTVEIMKLRGNRWGNRGKAGKKLFLLSMPVLLAAHLHPHIGVFASHARKKKKGCSQSTVYTTLGACSCKQGR